MLLRKERDLGRDVVVDVADVTFMDAAVLGALIAADEGAREQRAGLVLHAPPESCRPVDVLLRELGHMHSLSISLTLPGARAAAAEQGALRRGQVLPGPLLQRAADAMRESWLRAAEAQRITRTCSLTRQQVVRARTKRELVTRQASDRRDPG
jgi:ABC-type transporter Mla MlaB component